MSILELWRRLTLLHMNSMELHSQRQFMKSWSEWSKFKHSLIVIEPSREEGSLSEGKDSRGH